MVSIKNALRRGCAAIICAAVVSAGSAPGALPGGAAFAQDAAGADRAASAGISGENLIKVEKTCTASASGKTDLWHYSGGYWIVGNQGENKERIYDWQIDRIESGLAALYTQIDMTAALPEAAKAALEDGRLTGYKIGGVDASQAHISDGILYFSIVPVFALSNYRYSDFVDGSLAYDARLLPCDKGFNLYSVFSDKFKAIEGKGKFDPAQPSVIESPYIHPSLINDKSGKLKPGARVMLDGGVYDSAGLCIGSGTFAEGGAIGYSFVYNAEICFEYYEWEEAGELDDDGPEIMPSALVDAIIDAPACGYVGHPVYVRDASEYVIDGECFGAAGAYARGLASASLSGGGCTITKTSTAGYAAVWTRAGTKTLELTARAAGASDTAACSIQIYPVPSLAANLGGTQKQNRRQVLQIVIAQQPGYPVDDFAAYLCDDESGETVCIRPGQIPVNSEHIKCRTMKDAGSDEYYKIYELEFLTKFASERQLHFDFELSDTLGRTDQNMKSLYFNVKKDEPPEAVIKCADRFLRKAGGAAADIFAEDNSLTGGEVCKSLWFVDGVQAGSGAELHAQIGSVGYAELKLTVTQDIRDTLPEFIFPEDYMSSSAVKTITVDNIAPVVGMRMTQMQKAQLLLLSRGGDYESQCNELTESLRSDGVDLEVISKHSDGYDTGGELVYTAQWNDLDLLMGADTSVKKKYDTDILSSRFWGSAGGMDGKMPCGTSSITADEACVYMVTSTPVLASSSSNVSTFTRGYPYTLICKDARTGPELTEKWTLSIDSSMLHTSDNLANARLIADDSGKYICIVSEDQTLIASKSTGKYICTLQFELGADCYCCGGCIYTIKSDGIYRIDMKDHSIRQLYFGKIHAGSGKSTMLGGKILCIAQIGTVLYRCTFDPENEDSSLVLLEKSERGSLQSAGQTIAVDSAGRAIILFDSLSVYVYDADKVQPVVITASKAKSSSQIKSFACSRNSSGECNYFCAVEYYTSAGYYCNKLIVFRLNEGDTISVLKKKEAEEPYEYSIISYFTEIPEKELLVFSSGSRSEGLIFSGMRTTKPVVISINTKTGAECAAPSLTGGFSADHGCGIFEGGLMISRLNMSEGQVNFITKISEAKEKTAQRNSLHYLRSDADYSYCCDCTDREPDFDEIGAELTAHRQSSPAVMLQKGDSSDDAYIYTRVKLAHDREYFYEYDILQPPSDNQSARAQNPTSESISDIFKAIVSGEISAENNGDAPFEVVEEHFENFSDSDTDEFFVTEAKNIISNAFGVSCSTQSDETTYIESSADLKFVVPDGCVGVLSFDYTISGVDLKSHQAEIMIGTNGNLETWDNWAFLSQLGKTGHYIHSKALSAGEWTVRPVLKNYTNKHTECLLADNIKVLILRECSSAASGGERRISNGSAVSANTSGGSAHISGSLQTPKAISDYRPYPCIYYYAEPDGDYSAQIKSFHKKYPESLYPQRYKGSLNYTIPDGYFAAYMKITTESSSYHTSPLDPGYVSYEGISFSWLSKTWQIGYSSDFNVRYASYEKPGFAVFKKNIQSSGSFETDPKSYYYGYTWAGIKSVEMALADTNAPEDVANGDFVMIGDKLYIPGLKNDPEIMLRLNACGGLISNLKIYYFNDGKRIEVPLTPLYEWESENASASVCAPEQNEETAGTDDIRICRVNEPVRFSCSYSDYENDPSKMSCFRLEYTPFASADDPYPQTQTGPVTSSPPSSFQKEGRYCLYHWQYDNTGNPDFDKKSNVIYVWFYVSENPDDTAERIVHRGIKGEVLHTPEWDEIRKKEGRSADTFRPGEMLVLNAVTEGSPIMVTAEIEEYPQISAALHNTAENCYSGTLYDPSFAAMGGKVLNIRFTAYYADLEPAVDIVRINITQGGGYMLHRTL